MFIFTDLEPDDLLALLVLQKRGFVPSVVVVGEGNAAIKALRMKAYLRVLGLLDTQVLSGVHSNKPFHADGEECTSVFTTDELVEYQRVQTTGAVLTPEHNAIASNRVRDALLHFLHIHEEPLIVALKPMREFLHMDAPDKATVRKALSSATLALYGSFNLRCLFWLGRSVVPDAGYTARTQQEVLDWFAACKQVLLYESYHATGENNSINHMNMPRVYELLRQSSFNTQSNVQLQELLFKLIHSWNTHIVECCWKTCNELQRAAESRTLRNDEQAKLDRNLRIVRDAGTYVESQMVLADSGLAVVMLNDAFDASLQAVHIHFDENGYTKEETAQDSNVKLYRNVGFNAIEKAMSNILQ